MCLALRGVGIVELLQDAGAVDQSAEIAVSHGHRRHGHQFVGGLAQREALIGEKEERPVLAVVEFGNTDRAADGAAEFVADQVRRREVRRILPRFGDAEIVVARGFEERAVEVVGAGLRGQDDGRRRGELRAGIERFESGFLNGVGIGQRGLRRIGFAAEVAIGHRRAVLRILHALLHQSVGARAARFEAGDGVLRQPEHVAAVLRKLVDAAGIELSADGAAVVGGELNRFTRHGHLLGDLAHRQLGVQNRHLRVQQARPTVWYFFMPGGGEGHVYSCRRTSPAPRRSHSHSRWLHW